MVIKNTKTLVTQYCLFVDRTTQLECKKAFA